MTSNNDISSAAVAQQPATTEASEMPPVFFIIGGPGVGKGTVCEYLSRVFGFTHICAGDILRDEVKRGSKVGKEVIMPLLAAGQIVPAEVTVTLLNERVKEALRDHKHHQQRLHDNSISTKEEAASKTATDEATLKTTAGNRSQPKKSLQGILLDGFPRTIEQLKKYEETGRAHGVVFFECSAETMERRLLLRGREDDKVEIMRARFAANLRQCVPVMELFREQNLLHVVESGDDIEKVCATAVNLFQTKFGLAPIEPGTPLPRVVTTETTAATA